MDDQQAFAQFDKIAGTTTPAQPPQPVNQDRINELKGMQQQSQQPQTQQSDQSTQNQPDFRGAINTALGGNLPGAMLQAGDQLTGGHIKSVVDNLFPGAADLAKGGIPQWIKGMQERPAMSAENMALGFSGGGDLTEGINTGKALGGLPGALATGVKNIAEDIGNIPNAIKGALVPKTEAEILATVPEDVAKLKPNERDIWFNSKDAALKDANTSKVTKLQTQAEIDKANIEVNHGIAKQQIVDQATKDAQATTQKAQELTKKLGTASNEKVVSQRPSFIKLLQKQGNNYLDLVDSAMSEAGGKDASLQGNLGDKIDQSNPDPTKAAQIKSQLGITTDANGVNSGGPKTIGEADSQIKSLRQNVSSAGTKGTKVFSSADMQTQDAIRALGGHLQDNGVDLSKANKMWSEWAPIRDQLVQEGQIFNQAGTKSETLANTMVKVAQGKDPGSVKFINTLEQHLGPINAENKAIIAEMDANEKAALANSDWAKQAEAENSALANQNKATIASRTKTGIESAKAELEVSQKELQSQKIEANRQATLRDVLRKIKSGAITTVLGITGYEGLKKTVAPFLP
jgi:hypothetical protein